MADIKTTLRELSVATTIGLLIKKKTFDINELMIPEVFLINANMILKNKINPAIEKLILEKDSFDGELKQIIHNGYVLAKNIYNNNHFTFNSNDIIIWTGGNTQKYSPEDVIIGNFKFSLKENSYILENMGLYKLLNCLTGSNYQKGIHIFTKYAPEEYTQWFDTTWSLLINYLEQHKQWIIENGKSKIILQKDLIVLSYNNFNTSLPINCSLKDYQTLTNSKIREKVFAKFINKELSMHNNYKTSKRNCAITASKNLADELIQNLNYKSGLANFLRMYNETYYYAKINNGVCEIYKVPTSEELGNNIIISSITDNVPSDQANILTTIKNKKTGATLTFRNECRFSHGQFNGTPEAKLYYEKNSNLLLIYEQI